MYKSITLKSKRNTNINAAVFETIGKSPLLIFAHSFKSDMFEDGRYLQIGEYLQKNNICSITLDFPGNGSSLEGFEYYTLDNCLDDMEISYQYMLDNYDIDINSLALLGYSMGGRLISLFYKRHPEFNNLVFWAACNNPYTINDKFLKQDLSILLAQANKQGICDFFDIFSNQISKMSIQFINNLIDYDALSCLNSFNGNSLIIQGDKDITISYDNCENIYNSLSKESNKKLVIIKGADHGFGLWDNRKQDNDCLLNNTKSFLLENMKY